MSGAGLCAHRRRPANRPGRAGLGAWVYAGRRGGRHRLRRRRGRLACAPTSCSMDLTMPRCDRIEATRLLREGQPGSKVVVLTTYADDRSTIGAGRCPGLPDQRRSRDGKPPSPRPCNGRPSRDRSDSATPPVEAIATGPRPSLPLRLSNGEIRRASSSAKVPSKVTSTTCSPRSAPVREPGCRIFVPERARLTAPK